MKDMVDLNLWQNVMFGSQLVELFHNNQRDKYLIAVEIAELGEIHSPEVIKILKLKLEWFYFNN